MFTKVPDKAGIAGDQLASQERPRHPAQEHARSASNALTSACRKEAFERDLPKPVVESTLSRVVFRNMSSDEAPVTQANPGDPAQPAQPANPEAPEGPERVAPDGVLNLTDPKAMRAVAHPVRMALLELLEVAPTLTATQASEALGESPANCAFHLRTLAKYGYVTEAGGGKGRERPWKLATRQIHLTTHHEDAATAMSARALNEFWLDRVFQRARQILTSTDELPEEWRGAEESSVGIAFLTPAELREVSKRVLDMVVCHKERHDDPAKRPPGALPVEMVYLAYPLARLAELTQEKASGD